jgi:hypothetical protein
MLPMGKAVIFLTEWSINEAAFQVEVAATLLRRA